MEILIFGLKFVLVINQQQINFLTKSAEMDRLPKLNEKNFNECLAAAMASLGFFSTLHANKKVAGFDIDEFTACLAEVRSFRSFWFEKWLNSFETETTERIDHFHMCMLAASATGEAYNDFLERIVRGEHA